MEGNKELVIGVELGFAAEVVGTTRAMVVMVPLVIIVDMHVFYQVILLHLL